MTNFTPSDLDAHLGYWLRCLANYVHHSFAAKLAEHDVSVAQWVVLRTLYARRNMGINQVAKVIGVDKSSLSRMIERLVQKNLVSRKEGKDRRSVSLALTVGGTNLVPKLAILADENDQQFFSTLTTEKQQEFLATIKQLLNASGWNPATHGLDKMH